jgi:hypothetical protein
VPDRLPPTTTSLESPDGGFGDDRARADLDGLIAALCDERLDGNSAERLDLLVRTNVEARRHYIRMVQLHASLFQQALLPVSAVDFDDEAGATSHSMHDAMVLPSIRDAGDDDACETEFAPAPPSPPRVDRRPRGFWRSWRWRGAAALLLLAGVAAFVAFRPRPAAGVLDSLVDARWEAGAVASIPGHSLDAGATLSLASGRARVRLGEAGTGAAVVLYGPARLIVESSNAVRLERGMMTAIVSPPATGFTVRTPAADVVDLGTEFGVLVDVSGRTEAHVLRGSVRVQPVGGGAPTELIAGAAARVDGAGSNVVYTACRAAEFVHGKPVVDLVDVVAGGNGTSGRRGGGIDVTDGALVATLDRPPVNASPGDRRFHSVPGRSMVAGVFVPAGPGPVVLDPDGHSFNGFPATDNSTWYPLWAGGAIPTRSAGSMSSYPTSFGGFDYDAPGHGVLFMHANKGVTFDLQAIRAGANGNRPFRTFRATGANTAGRLAPKEISSYKIAVTERSAFWVFVDGQLRFSRSPISRAEVRPFNVSVELGPDDRFLTLVATDGGDRLHSDWITLGDPRLE